MTAVKTFVWNHLYSCAILLGCVIGMLINLFLWDFHVENGSLKGDMNIGSLGSYFEIGGEGYTGGYTWKGNKLYKITID